MKFAVEWTAKASPLLRHILLAAVAVHALACAAPPGEVNSPEEIDVQTVYGQAPPAVGGIPSIVSLTPLGGHGIQPGSATVDQIGLQFSPAQLIVPTGSTVTFTNSESLPHNVRLTRVGEAAPFFDRDADPDESVDVVFEASGGIDVACAAHPGMRAFIYITDASHSVFADRDGTFTFTKLNEGDYDFLVWSADESLRQGGSVHVGPPPFEVVFPPQG